MTIRHVDITAGRGATGQAARANCVTFIDADEDCDGVVDTGASTFPYFVNLEFTYGADGVNGAAGGAHAMEDTNAAGGLGGAGGVWNSSDGNLRDGQQGDDNEGGNADNIHVEGLYATCLLYTSPSPRDKRQSRMPSSA